jgi:Inner membrane protein YgaP-like, transmembrane domain
MTNNISALDRKIRAFLIAPVAVVAAFLLGLGTPAGIILLVVAGIMLATAWVSFCPLYRLLRISPGVSAGH